MLLNVSQAAVANSSKLLAVGEGNEAIAESNSCSFAAIDGAAATTGVSAGGVGGKFVLVVLILLSALSAAMHFFFSFGSDNDEHRGLDSAADESSSVVLSICT